MPVSSSSPAVSVGVGCAVAGAVIERARGGEAQGPGLDRALGDRGHGGDVGLGGRLAVRAALAHDEDAQRRVRQLAADVDVEATLRQAVQVVGIALPVPRQALGQDREGDVLDAFHQPDQPVVIVRAAGREADAAVAHHHGGDPMPRRGLHPLVPGRLAVVVGVDVDEAGRDDLAARVDLLGAGPRDRGRPPRCGRP